MKIPVNQSAKNNAWCRRSRAILNLVSECDGLSCKFKLHALLYLCFYISEIKAKGTSW